MKHIDDFKAVLGFENGGIADMERLLSLAETYGYRDWLVFDATIVRGLSYYTGVVFEAFDKKVGCGRVERHVVFGLALQLHDYS
jgi:histidyl-tRNA synthetase